MPARSTPESVRKMLQENFGHLPPDACWIWPKFIDKAGYGRMRYQLEANSAHRLVWIALNGPIDAGLHVDHLCRVRACVNPSHLEPVTPRENTMRGICISAVNARKTHCNHGHEFSPENTLIGLAGRRSCRACGRARWKAKSERRKARKIIDQSRGEG